MFATDRVRLRPPTPDDAPNMFRLQGDPELHLITDGEPFVPRHVGQLQARLEKQVTEPPDGETRVSLLAETVVDGTFLGSGSLWGIDAFNRYAHLGISLLPEARGRGYGTAEKCGFVYEGTQREREYDGDGFADIVIYGLLRRDWTP